VAVVMICMFGQYTCRKPGGPGSDFDDDKVGMSGEREPQVPPLRFAPVGMTIHF
jgi:hypothetical protein